MNRLNRTSLMIVAALGLCLPGVCQTTYSLSNDRVTVVVDPGKGRIISFSRADNRAHNVLWTTSHPQVGDGWTEWGGDVVWPEQNAENPIIIGRVWPPDNYIDGKPWTVISHTASEVTMQSPVSPYIHAYVRRTIRIDRRQAKITISNVIHQVTSTPYPLNIWSVTYIKPEYELLNIGKEQPDPGKTIQAVLEGSRPNFSVERYGDAVKTVPLNTNIIAIGTFGAWNAAVFPNDILVQATPYNPKACYADGASVDVFSNIISQQIETRSPFEHLQPGTSMSNTVTWWLLPRKSGSSAPDIIKQIEGTLSASHVR